MTDFVCLLIHEFWLSLWKIALCSVILLLPLLIMYIHLADLEMKKVNGDGNGTGTTRLAIQSKPYVSFDIQSNLY